VERWFQYLSREVNLFREPTGWPAGFVRGLRRSHPGFEMWAASFRVRIPTIRTSTCVATKTHNPPYQATPGLQRRLQSHQRFAARAGGECSRLLLPRVRRGPGFAFKGRDEHHPAGSEVLQEPRSIQGLPGAVVPTTITYAVRIVPSGALPIHGWGVETPKLTLDFGLAQAAGNYRTRGGPPGTASVRLWYLIRLLEPVCDRLSRCCS